MPIRKVDTCAHRLAAIVIIRQVVDTNASTTLPFRAPITHIAKHVGVPTDPGFTSGPNGPFTSQYFRISGMHLWHQATIAPNQEPPPTSQQGSGSLTFKRCHIILGCLWGPKRLSGAHSSLGDNDPIGAGVGGPVLGDGDLTLGGGATLWGIFRGAVEDGHWVACSWDYRWDDSRHRQVVVWEKGSPPLDMKDFMIDPSLFQGDGAAPWLIYLFSLVYETKVCFNSTRGWQLYDT
jgi:hypothetical protein